MVIAMSQLEHDHIDISDADEHHDDDPFDRAVVPTSRRSAPYPPDSDALGPPELQNAGIPPRHVSSMAGSRAFEKEFRRGAEMLGLNTPRKPLHPQQAVVAGVLNAVGDDGLSLHSTVVICIPRRASKTTSIWAVALGRCMEREEYAVAFTAQTGTKARQRFLKDLVAPLTRRYGKGEDAGFKINRSQGGEHISFANGSSIVVLPPIPDSFRGDGYDMVIIDEAQTQGPEETAELKAAILPTFDTRPGAQLVIAGTAGEHRSGMLWSALEDGREGRASTGIVEYAAPDDLSEEEMSDPEVWKAAHPGIDTLTTLTSIQRNFEAMREKFETFAAEYLGVWPLGSGARFLNGTRWEQGRVTGDLPQPPSHFALGIATHESQSFSAIVAAWRDQDGRAHLLVIDHRPGVKWLAGRTLELSRKYRVPVAHDTRGPVLTEVQILERQRPSVNLAPQKTADVTTGAALIVRDLDQGMVVHYDQEPLNDAARLAVKRKIGPSWAFGRNSASFEDDITSIEAASYALHVLDGTRERKPRKAIMAD